MQFYVWSLWMKSYAATIHCMKILSSGKILYYKIPTTVRVL